MIVGNHIIYLKETTSTMDVCKELASDKFEEGTVVFANYQNSGRGRFNRVWISPAGINLHVSILLSPTFDQMKYLNMAATLAVIDTIKEITNISGQIKWPNDVQVNGKKISGILIESESKLDIDLKGKYFIGDKESDILAGRNHGCTPLLIKTGGYGEKVFRSRNSPPDEHCFNNLLDAAEFIIGNKNDYS